MGKVFSKYLYFDLENAGDLRIWTEKLDSQRLNIKNGRAVEFSWKFDSCGLFEC